MTKSGISMAPGTQEQRIDLNLSKDLLASLDEWRGHQADRPSRSEAVKRLVEQGLEQGTTQSITPAQLTSENDV